MPRTARFCGRCGRRTRDPGPRRPYRSDTGRRRRLALALALVVAGVLIAALVTARSSREVGGRLDAADVAVGAPAPAARTVGRRPAPPPVRCRIDDRPADGAAAGCPAWTVPPPDGRWRAVDAADGVVVATSSGGATALEATDGTVRWSWSSTEQVDPSTAPAIAGDVVAVPLRLRGTGPLGGVTVLELATGQTRWTAATGPRPVTVTLDAGSNVVVSASPAVVHARDLDTGAPRWQRHLSGRFVAGVAVADDVLVVHATGAVLGLDLVDGHERWRVPAPRALAVEVVGDLAVVARPDGATALDTADGATRWRLDHAGVRSVTPTGDASRLVAATAHELVVLDPATGSVEAAVAVAGPVGEVTSAVGRRVHVATPQGLQRLGLRAGSPTWTLVERELPPARHAETAARGSVRLVAVVDGVVAGFAPPR